MKRFNWARSKWIGGMALVACAVAAGVFLYGSSSAKEAGKDIVVEVTRGDIRFSASGTSTLVPKLLHTITTPSDGIIKTMNLERNQPVKEGDILLEISNPTLENNLARAKFTLQSMEKELDELQQQMDNLHTRAPIEGRWVAAAIVEEGMTINNRSTRLGSIVDNRNLKVNIPFALEDAVLLQAGQEVELFISGFARSRFGVVKSIEQEPRPDLSGGRLLNVVVSIVNDYTMDAGMRASGTVHTDGRTIESRGEGTLQYANSVSVTAGVTGSLRELRVETGSTVRSGDLIAVIDNDQLTDDRTNRLNSLEQQRLSVQELEERVADLVIRAPFDGVFSPDFVNQRVNVLQNYSVGSRIGNNVQLGAVANFDVMQLAIQVDELDLPNIRAGMPAQVLVDSYPGRIFQGEVSMVSTVGAAANGVTFFDVVIDVRSVPGSELRYAMTATGEILIQDKRDIVLLPIQALQQTRNMRYVALQLPDGAIEPQHPIEIGIRSSTHVEVTAGLEVGDRVVIPVLERQEQGMSQQEIDQLRQQFQQGGGAIQIPAEGGGGININPEDIQRIREQFQQGGGGNIVIPGGGGGGGGTGGAGGGGGFSGGGGGMRGFGGQ